ncbi:MAG: hypothetical protein IJK58_04720 [Clostridia bacterium]|nr:hypothetical protein [Clostridia bacterium]
MKKIVCAVMAAVMLALCFSLYSCKKQTLIIEPPEPLTPTPAASTPDSVVGIWTTTVSALKFLFPKNKWDTDSREWKDSEITLSINFSDSGSFILGLSKPEVREFLKNNVESANAMFGYTLEEAMEEGKYESVDALVEDMVNAFTSLNKNGTYTYSNGILKTEVVSTTHTHGAEEEEEVPAEIRMAGNSDQLIFTEYVVESDEHGLFNESVLPLAFDKFS